MKQLSKTIQTLMVFPLFMRFGWFGESYPCTSLFPPVDRAVLHDLVLAEILQERVVSSRGRKVPRGVKRKMSTYKLRPRVPLATQWVDYESHIAIVK